MKTSQGWQNTLAHTYKELRQPQTEQVKEIHTKAQSSQTRTKKKILRAEREMIPTPNRGKCFMVQLTSLQE
jgi:hypothetical protein